MRCTFLCGRDHPITADRIWGAAGAEAGSTFVFKMWAQLSTGLRLIRWYLSDGLCWRPDGTRNGVHLQRLKDKVGHRSREVELDEAWGVLADMALESEASLLRAMRLAQAFEHESADASDPLERACKRVMTPAAQFWVCKRAVERTGEAMEVLGAIDMRTVGVPGVLQRALPA